MQLKLIECPRDAMQGIVPFIDTKQKIRYISQLLRIGFDTIDFGSFVSPKAIPQMRDTAEVLDGLELTGTRSSLLAIIANLRGAEEAAAHAQISYLGFPFSVSETFQQRNTNSSISESLARVEEIQEICQRTGKRLVVYLSMAFGNPYGDPWDPDIVAGWTEAMVSRDIRIIALSDTIGAADENTITSLFSRLVPAFPGVEIGAHLHAAPDTVQAKLAAAYHAGCRRFDGALKGFGGCPMAKDDLVGNMNTELMQEWFKAEGIETGLQEEELSAALKLAAEVFPG